MQVGRGQECGFGHRPLKNKYIQKHILLGSDLQLTIFRRRRRYANWWSSSTSRGCSGRSSRTTRRTRRTKLTGGTKLTRGTKLTGVTRWTRWTKWTRRTRWRLGRDWTLRRYQPACDTSWSRRRGKCSCALA